MQTAQNAASGWISRTLLSSKSHCLSGAATTTTPIHHYSVPQSPFCVDTKCLLPGYSALQSPLWVYTKFLLPCYSALQSPFWLSIHKTAAPWLFCTTITLLSIHKMSAGSSHNYYFVKSTTQFFHACQCWKAAVQEVNKKKGNGFLLLQWKLTTTLLCCYKEKLVGDLCILLAYFFHAKYLSAKENTHCH